MFNLENKKVLITGALGGIGSALVEKYKEAGAIIGITDRNIEKLEKFKSLNPNSYTFKCDLFNKEDVETLIEKADKEMNGVDILICNAGMTKDMLAIKMKSDDFDAVIDVNLKSNFILNRDAVKFMSKRRFGRIINMASIVGVMGNPGQANYAASKGGLIAMSKSISEECAKRGVTVNCIAPGFIASPMTDVLTDEQKAALLAKIPMGKMGTGADVASLAVFLSSEEAGYITGQTMHVNGGMLRV